MPVELYRSPGLIRRPIVAIGSHDLTLDLLADEVGRRYPGRSLQSANVGSVGGLLALARGEAHFAGSHLLDEATGDYNVAYIKRLLAEHASGVVGFRAARTGPDRRQGQPQGHPGPGRPGPAET